MAHGWHGWHLIFIVIWKLWQMYLWEVSTVCLRLPILTTVEGQSIRPLDLAPSNREFDKKEVGAPQMDLVYPCVQPTYRVLRARLVILHQAGNISYMALESNARGQNVSGASNGPYALPCTTDNQHTGYLGFCTSKVLIVQERKGYSLAYLHD